MQMARYVLKTYITAFMAVVRLPATVIILCYYLLRSCPPGKQSRFGYY